MRSIFFPFKFLKFADQGVNIFLDKLLFDRLYFQLQQLFLEVITQLYRYLIKVKNANFGTLHAIFHHF